MCRECAFLDVLKSALAARGRFDFTEEVQKQLRR